MTFIITVKMKKILTIAIILLFLGSSLTVSAHSQNSIKVTSGNWFYVGGSGPGNYSTIQAAINASSDGDTVFVYEHSSPYQENVIIDKGIVLIGENLNTEIINNGIHTVMTIEHDNVKISTFLLPGWNEPATEILVENCENVNISNCVSSGCWNGIVLQNVNDSNVYYNHFNGWVDCLCVSKSNRNNIQKNNFARLGSGGTVVIEYSNENHFQYNNFNLTGENSGGFQINGGGDNYIDHNNFFCPVSNYKSPSKWYNNYYKFVFFLYWVFEVKFHSLPYIISHFTIDWHPAKTPYYLDVPGGIL